MFSTCADLGYDGIEIRGVADQMYAPKIKAFSEERISETRQRLKNNNIVIPILTSGAFLNNNPDYAAAEKEICDYVSLAEKLGVKYVRVMGDPSPGPSGSFDFDSVCEKYAALCDMAAGSGVSLLIETNGALGDSALMKKLIEKTNKPNAGVLWDIHHTVRFFGETPEKTVSNIGGYIKHTHLKDSEETPEGISYVLTGYGDAPIKEAVRELMKTGYDGYFSYEWVKRWSRSLAEPGVAFYQYINFMRSIKL